MLYFFTKKTKNYKILIEVINHSIGDYDYDYGCELCFMFCVEYIYCCIVCYNEIKILLWNHLFKCLFVYIFNDNAFFSFLCIKS